MKKILFIIPALLVLWAFSWSTTPEGYQVYTIKTTASNIYVVSFDKTLLMIDCGNVGDSLKIERKMRRQGIEPSEIDFLLLSHGHLDHAGNAAYFQRKYGVQLIGSAYDNHMFHSGINSEICPTNTMAKVIEKAFKGLQYESFELDIKVDSLLNLETLGMKGSVWILPGHTPGSVVYLLDDNAFVGDLIRGQPIRPKHPVRHYYMCDEHDNDLDIQWLLDKPGIRTWYPGHFGSLSTDKVRKRMHKL